METEMINPHRGDVALVIDGVTHVLRLTLGSLAMLEAALGSKGLQELGQKLQAGRFSAGDVCHILAAGFCGAGVERTATDVASMVPASALVQATEAAANLLAVTFGGGNSSSPSPSQLP
jgi:Phage tail tube protein, GTA-gp10